MSKISLKQAAAWCGGTVEEKYADIEFLGANNDTRTLQPGQLFLVDLLCTEYYRRYYDACSKNNEKTSQSVLDKLY